jgi:hypothetical protein
MSAPPPDFISLIFILPFIMASSRERIGAAGFSGAGIPSPFL